MARYSGTKTDCEELARILDKADGGPKLGVHVGGGVHVEMPATWDGTGEVPPGWTSHKASVRANVDSTFAIEMPTDSDTTKLTAAELAKLQASLAVAEVVAEEVTTEGLK